MAHIPVLLKEVIDGLDFQKEDKNFLDATFGGGGHSSEVCKKFPWIKIIALDVDREATAKGQKNLKEDGCPFEIVTENFRNLDKVLSDLRVQKLDKILFDLGFSSDQMESSGRGFSFQRDEPLIMTLANDWKGKLTAYEIVNSSPKSELERILREYGEEPLARKISEGIAKARKINVIKTTGQLVKVLEEVLPSRLKKKKIHPATRTFQALRIAVNDELESLRIGLKSAWDKLANNGRLAVISFHSLEDRITKVFFRELKKEKSAVLINKKPIVPTEEEVLKNRRARSAKLRIIKKE
jgi:16S rRNA (cytosine1402-N4)-methyltransferase